MRKSSIYVTALILSSLPYVSSDRDTADPTFQLSSSKSSSTTSSASRIRRSIALYPPLHSLSTSTGLSTPQQQQQQKQQQQQCRRRRSPFRVHDPQLIKDLASLSDNIDAAIATYQPVFSQDANNENNDYPQEYADFWESSSSSSSPENEEALDEQPFLSDVDNVDNSIVITDEHEHKEGSEQRQIRLDSPLVYRYYGRRRARTHSSGSVPFIFLSRNVDHCKDTAQELASRGFSVIACERVAPDGEEGSSELKSLGFEESAALISELLDALRWNKAVIVGVDSETVIALQAALKLAPDRVAGLVLCGNLQEAGDFVAQFEPSGRPLMGSFEIDRFLQVELDCPFAIVWDGEEHLNTQQASTESIATTESLRRTRYLVLGGGSAPHRRRPELVAWSLTRFVEERIAPDVILDTASRARGGQLPEPVDLRLNAIHAGGGGGGGIGFQLREFFSPGSFVVTGRIVATAIFYLAMMKIFVYQYYNFHDGMINFNAKLEILGSIPRRTGKLFSSLLTSVGSLLVRIRKSRTEDNDSDLAEAIADSSAISPTTKDESHPERTTEEKSEKDQKEPEQAPVKPPPSFRPVFFLDHVVA